MIARSPSLGPHVAYQPPCKPGHANRGNGSRLLTRRNIRTHVAADDALLRSQAQQLENSLADSENSVLPDAAQLTLARRMVATLFGAEDNSLLADNFTFEGPVVGPLNKEQYCAAVSSFNLRDAFPDYTVEAKDLRVEWDNKISDKEYKVWLTTVSRGTHKAPLALGSKVIAATGAKYKSGPEAVSLTFDGKSGLCTRMTAGYVMDKSQGNTNGLGGVYGIAHAVGSPLPPPGSLEEKLQKWTGGRWSGTLALWAFNVVAIGIAATRSGTPSVTAVPPPPAAAVTPAPKAEEEKKVEEKEADKQEKEDEEEEEEEEEEED